MSRAPVMETQARHAPVLSVVCRCAVLVAVLCAPLSTHAYDVHYDVQTSSAMTAEQEGFCPQNGGAHTMMPIQESFQTLASEALAASGAQEAPIGAKNLHSTCTTQACEWLLTTGLMNGSTVEKATFFKGVVYNGEDHTEPVPGMYTNFQKGLQPVAFFTARDKTLVKMVRTGQWENEVPATAFYTWVCEHYEFTPEESRTAHLTDENGFLIPSPKKFPWWAGLLIAVGVCGIVALILVCCCCCNKHNREMEEEREVANDLKAGENIHRIPTQSELGIGRSSSIYQDGDGYDSGVESVSGMEANPLDAGYGDADGFEPQVAYADQGAYPPEEVY